MAAAGRTLLRYGRAQSRSGTLIAMLKLILSLMSFYLCAAAPAPALPPGTVPMYAPDPVLSADPATPAGFGCFGACGASCDCADRVDDRITLADGDQVCDWQTIRCNTHDFCRWHDLCYQRCDEMFPGRDDDRSSGRFYCYRSCDASCATGDEPKPIGGWRPADLSPGQPPEALGAAACLLRLANAPGVPYDGVTTYAQLIGCRAP